MNDKQWKERVEERLVNLTTAQKTTDEDLSKLWENVDSLDRVIRGNPEGDREGMAQAINRLQAEVTKFNRILEKDYSGHGGLLNDINFLMDERKRHEARENNAWKYITAISVQALILLGLIIVNWDNIEGFIVLRQHIHQAAVIEKETKQKKIARAHRRRKVVEEPKEVQEDGAENQSVPE